MPEQEIERPRKRKKVATLEFEAGKVFSVEKKDFELDITSATFLAQKGQGGSRRSQ